MRIYQPELDKTLKEIEIYLTKEQFKVFASRINEMCNNPLNRKEELLHEIVDGDKEDYNVLNQVEIMRHNKESIGEIWGERNKMIILFDK